MADNATPQIDKLIEQLDESRATAMQAMQYSANLGVVLRFLEMTFVCHDDKELIQLLLETCQSLNIDCVAKYIQDDQSFTKSISHEITPDEESIIAFVKDDSRIYSQGQITVFSFDLISLLVRNMPVDDDYNYGIMIDIVATMMNGIESRLKLLAKDKKVLSIQEKVINLTDSTMHKLEECLSKVNNEAFISISDLLVNIKETIIKLDIDETYEKDIIDMLNSHGSMVKQMSTEGIKVNESFNHIKSTIEESTISSDVELF